jgi:hypothetical protein
MLTSGTAVRNSALNSSTDLSAGEAIAVTEPSALRAPDFLGRRFTIVLLVLGHGLLFGTYIGVYSLADDARFITALAGELLAAAVCSVLLLQSLRWFHARRFTAPEDRYVILVHAVSLYYLAIILATFANADTAGLLSSGGRLDFYFENPWFRRLITYSYVPSAIATYLSLRTLLGASSRHKAAALANLALLVVSSLMLGSKGAAVLIVAAALPLVFTTRRLPWMRIGVGMGLLVVGYVGVFLALSDEPLAAALSIVQRFYLSIDMTLFLRDPGISELLSDRLGDVWTEVFRSLGSAGVRVADEAIGIMVYQYEFGTFPETGPNCRFGSLLLLYPARLDFLIGFPLLVYAVAHMMRVVLSTLRLSWAAYAGIPFLAFNAFQDVYWFASHFLPLVLAFLAVRLARVIQRAPFHHPADAA